MRLVQKLCKLDPFKGKEKKFAPLLDDRKDGKKLDYFIAALAILNENKCYCSRDKLIEKSEILLVHSEWKVYQLMLCLEKIKQDPPCSVFIEKFIPNMEKNIFWAPFIEELTRYDETSMTMMLLFDNVFENHLHAYDDRVVMAEEAIIEFGLIHLGEIEFGKNFHIEIGSPASFNTTSDGTVKIPPYEDTFQTKAENLLSYLISFRHELGHHIWGSFVINLHQDEFDYESFGVEFAGFDKHVLVKRDEAVIELTKFEDIMNLVKNPDLLSRIFNVVDDGRIDANNMKRYPYRAEEYRMNILKLLEKRPCVNDTEKLLGKMPLAHKKDEITALIVLLEAITQYAITGKINGEIPEYAKEKFEKCRVIIDSMQGGFESNGTHSMNCAIKIYNIIQSEIDNLDLPDTLHNSKTDMKGTNLVYEKKKTRESKGNKSPGKDGSKPKKGAFIHDKPNTSKYDGYDGEKHTRNEHEIHEVKATGEPIIVDPIETAKISGIFKKYAPRAGVFERGLDEGDIDPELFQDFLNGLRCGRYTDQNYHSNIIYEERDVATGILIDCSGSMEIVMDQVLQACGVLGVASAILNDPLIIGGFTSIGNNEVFISMKDVKENEILRPTEFGGTPIGGPVRHMANKMTHPGLAQKGFKQMFIITDGQANVGISPIEDAKMAVSECWKKHHIKPFGIGICSNENERVALEKYLEDIFNPGNYLVVSALDIERGYLHHFFEKYYRKTIHKLK